MSHTMILALFDLDNTLLDGDSDLEWGELLAAEGAMDVERCQAFHADYHAGTLDIQAFLAFQLEPLAREPMPRLLAWRERLMAERIQKRLNENGRRAVRAHADRGHELVLITATHRFLVEPIARELGIPHVIATEPEVQGGRFTGRVHGPPCFREGKIACLDHWLARRGVARRDIQESWFYSDSHNDLPLLSAVHHPVAVDPDPWLRAHAVRRGWEIAAWRHNDIPYSSPPSG